MNSAEMLVFLPMFALAVVVTAGWAINEVQRLRSRAWLAPVRFAAPLKLTEPAAPSTPAQVASNDEQHRLAA